MADSLNNEIMRGANTLASVVDDEYTVEEAVDDLIVAKEARKAKRRAAREGTPEQKAEAAAVLGEMDRQFTSKAVESVPFAVDPFGEDSYREYGLNLQPFGDERRPQDDFQPYSNDEKEERDISYGADPEARQAVEDEALRRQVGRRVRREAAITQVPLKPGDKNYRVGFLEETRPSADFDSGDFGFEQGGDRFQYVDPFGKYPNERPAQLDDLADRRNNAGLPTVQVRRAVGDPLDSLLNAVREGRIQLDTPLTAENFPGFAIDGTNGTSIPGGLDKDGNPIKGQVRTVADLITSMSIQSQRAVKGEGNAALRAERREAGLVKKRASQGPGADERQAIINREIRNRQDIDETGVRLPVPFDNKTRSASDSEVRSIRKQAIKDSIANKVSPAQGATARELPDTNRDQMISAIVAEASGVVDPIRVLQNEQNDIARRQQIMQDYRTFDNQFVNGNIGSMGGEIQVIGGDYVELEDNYSGSSIEDVEGPSRFRTGSNIDPTQLEDAVPVLGANNAVVGYTDQAGNPIELEMWQGPGTRSQSWLKDTLTADDGRGGRTNFGPTQSVISEDLGLLNQRIAQVYGDTLPQIGNLDDLDIATQAALQSPKFKNKKWWKLNPETGKNQLNANPYIDEFLQSLDYSGPEKERLGNSLFQLGQAQNGPIPNNPQPGAMNGPFRQIDVGPLEAGIANIGAGESVDVRAKGDVKEVKRKVKDQIKKIKAEDVMRIVKPGRDPNAREGEAFFVAQEDIFIPINEGQWNEKQIRVARKGEQVLLPQGQIDVAGAQAVNRDVNMPGMGAAIDPIKSRQEGPERPRWITPKARAMSPSERVRRNPKMGEVQNEVERRFNEDAAIRGIAPTSDPVAQEFRRRDAEFAEKGRQVEIDNNAIEIGELVKLVRAGKMNPVTPSDFGRTAWSQPNQRDDLGSPVPQRFNEDISEVRRQYAPQSRAAGIAAPQTATSAVTSPRPDTTPLAVRGGWMSGDNRGAVVNPWSQSAPPIQHSMEPDPWEQTPGTGNGITQSQQKVSPSAPSPEPARKEATSPALKKVKEERKRRKPKAPATPNNRNALIRDILGYSALGVGAGVGGKALYTAGYNGSQQEEEARY